MDPLEDFLYQITHKLFGFTCTQLDEYTKHPNVAELSGLYQALCYASTHTHCTMIYPRIMFDGYHTLRADFDPPKYEDIHLPNGLIVAVNSDHARDNHTWLSYQNLIALINNVSFNWKTTP